MFICLSELFVTSTPQALDPRGPRPVEQGYKADKCATQKEWSFCADEDWGPKCPSGCRVLGLMDKHDHEMLKKINRIRTLLEKNQAQHGSTDRITKQTYDYLKDQLTTTAGNDNNYYDISQRLRKRIIDIKIKIDQQLRLMYIMKEQIKKQVSEMQRMEVDIDMKLRGCKGSCKTYIEFSVDQASYVTLDKQMAQLEAETTQSLGPSRPLPMMKSRLLKDQELDSNKLFLEDEGSSTSPASVSKDPGTSTSSSSFSSTSSGVGDWGEGTASKTSSSSSSSSYSSSSSSSTSCTTIIRRLVQTEAGPVTKEEVIEGGPGCKAKLSQGGMSSFFPSLSAHSTTSEAKGSLLDEKTGFDLFDMGVFTRDITEDDHPDVHARSMKSSTVVLQGDYVGKDCADILRQHARGAVSGLFAVRLGEGRDSSVVQVYCDQTGFMGGWLLVQQRETGLHSFNRSWAEYSQGFGSVDAQGRGELWLGNRYLHLLTNQSESLLRVELEDWEGGVATAQYSIRVGAEEEGFRLEVSGYEGGAGDALGGAGPLMSHSGMRFSTFDRDLDRWGEGSCAELYGGGWWYNNCLAANLKGLYYMGKYDPENNAPYKVENGVVWTPYKPADYSLKKVRMSIRPAAF
ncbi:Fibrinogen alpha chain [Merluccius polli]|uniref:Fibrinogen alpha chain n=1 Tax=Merluccius polli TaxID=89951 RepID=A0AA47NP11_MERPO|nr:Fibrinogen alpha chain [Merluccius polli]